MAQQLINNGTYANDPSAEEIYTAFGKVNSNETQLFAIPGQVQSGLYNYAPDTGVINAYAMTLNPTLTTYASGAIFTLGNISATNNGPSTLNINGVGIFPIHAAGGQALQGGELVAGHSAIFQVNSTATAFDLVQTLGGSLPVAPATQSNHAVNLGQAQTNFAAIGGNSSHTFTASAGVGASNVPTLAQVQAGDINYGADTGTANTYAITLTPAPAAITPGMTIGIDAIVASNTGAATLNVNALGALPIQSAGGVALQGGEFVTGGSAILQANAGATAWNLIWTSGAQPVAAASQSGQAINLGQFTGPASALNTYFTIPMIIGGVFRNLIIQLSSWSSSGSSANTVYSTTVTLPIAFPNVHLLTIGNAHDASSGSAGLSCFVGQSLTLNSYNALVESTSAAPNAAGYAVSIGY